MRLDRQTLAWFSLGGKIELTNILLKGLAEQKANELKNPEDEQNLEFLECCDVWSDTLKEGGLVKVCEDMNAQADDMFGTEGWQKGLGLPDW
jgi:hypothetical protein